MTGKPVARVGDVVATISTSTTYPGATGAWQAAPVVPTPVSTARAGGTAVLVGASCVFTFSGNTTSTPSSPFTSPPSTVTLVPGTTALHVAGSAPLVHGDTATDAFGNRLDVVSTATWRTE